MASLTSKFHLGTTLMQKLCKAEKKENFVFSPLSLSTAFSMLVAGLDGDTKKEVLNLLGFEKEETLHALNAELIANKDLPIKIANKYLSDHRVEVHEAFSALLKKQYESEVELVNFAANADKITNDVNAWVAGKTNNMIKELLAKGVLNAETVLVLLNAVYFKGTWVEAFDPLPTELDFKMRDGSVTKKKFMKLKSSILTYTETEHLKMVKIPYKEAGCYMVVALPKDEAKHIDDVLGELSPAEMSEAIENLNSTRSPKVELYMPKFKIEYTYDSLVPTMKALGTKKIFTPGVGDFSRLFSKADGVLSVSDIIHKAVIDVDEKGTEAAAATAVVCMIKCAMMAPPPSPKLFVDRSFLYSVLSKDDIIMFQGVCFNPTPANECT